MGTNYKDTTENKVQFIQNKSPPSAFSDKKFLKIFIKNNLFIKNFVHLITHLIISINLFFVYLWKKE